MYFLHSLYSLLLYILKVINKIFIQYNFVTFQSPVICVHLDQLCALFCDPNNLYQSEARFTMICEDGNFKDLN